MWMGLNMYFDLEKETDMQTMKAIALAGLEDKKKTLERRLGSKNLPAKSRERFELELQDVIKSIEFLTNKSGL